MTSRLHVVIGTLAGTAVGAAGALLLRPRQPLHHCEIPAGHYYRVGDLVFVDQPFVEWLRSKIEPVEREWVVFPFKKFGVFVRQWRDRQNLPGQKGLLYEVRQDLDRDNDRQVASFLDGLLRLGAVEHGGAFQSWSDVEVYWNAALRQAARGQR